MKSPLPAAMSFLRSQSTLLNEQLFLKTLLVSTLYTSYLIVYLIVYVSYTLREHENKSINNTLETFPKQQDRRIRFAGRYIDSSPKRSHPLFLWCHVFFTFARFLVHRYIQLKIPLNREKYT